MVCMTVSAQVNSYQHAPAGVTEPYWPGLKDTVARTSIAGRWVSVDHRFSKYSNIDEFKSLHVQCSFF